MAEETGSVRTYPNEPRHAATTTSAKIAKAQKPSPIVDSEAAETIVVLFPPIKETEYRGQHRTSYSFIGPDDSSVFAFDSFKQARKEREKMRPLYLQAAVFDGVVRVKSKGGRPALSEDE